MPDLDRPGFAVAAVRTAPAGFGREGQLGYLALALVAASPAFDEEGRGLLGHGASLNRQRVSTASPAPDHCMSMPYRENEKGREAAFFVCAGC